MGEEGRGEEVGRGADERQHHHAEEQHAERLVLEHRRERDAEQDHDAHERRRQGVVEQGGVVAEIGGELAQAVAGAGTRRGGRDHQGDVGEAALEAAAGAATRSGTRSGQDQHGRLLAGGGVERVLDHVAGAHGGRGAEAGGELHHGGQAGSVAGGALDEEGGPGRVEAVGEELGMAHGGLGGGAIAFEQDQHALGGRPGTGDRVGAHVVAEVGVDVLGRAAECDLAQRAEIALAEEAGECPAGDVGAVDAAVGQAGAEFRRRDVDELDLVGVLEHAVGQCFSHAPVMRATVSFRLSRCWTLSVAQTSMPAARRVSTSSQRLAWREPGTLVWASSSTSRSAGRRARAASRSNSGIAWPR